MKRWSMIGSLVLLLTVTGCGQNKVQETANQPEVEIVPVTQEIGEQEKVYKLVEEDFKDFFDQYFSFTDEQILKLNQVRNEIDNTYWGNLADNYTPLIKKKLEKYLDKAILETLSRQYMHDQLNMPKWVLLNQYAVSGQAKVENIEIQSTRDLGDEVVYEIAVTTINPCYPVTQFVDRYGWSNEAGYWVERVEGEIYEERLGLELDEKEREALEALETVEPDKMKLKQSFWITVKKQDDLKVTGISNVETWGIGAENKQQILDTQYITRLPYQSETTVAQKAVVIKVFERLMHSSKDDMIYFNKAYDTSSNAFTQMWCDFGLENEMMIDSEDYRIDFPKTLTPYKDEISRLDILEEGIQVVPSLYSTQNISRFLVNIPVEALLNNNQIVYYRYQYFIEMQQNKVCSIQFVEMERIPEAEMLEDEEAQTEVGTEAEAEVQGETSAVE